jgi:hypothetical protein
MFDPLAAYRAPPSVTQSDGEVLIMGDGVCAAYTPEAAVMLAQRLLAAAQDADGEPTADPSSVIWLRE